MTLSKKICMLGDFAVGKTSLVRRHVLGVFSPDYHATLGVNIYKHSERIDTPDAGSLQLDEIVWDIEGSEDQSGLFSTYVHGASGAIVVGDVLRDDTVDSMARHGRFFLAQRPGRSLVFALNKVDLLDFGAGAAGIEVLAEEFGAPVFETSALSGAAVPGLFRALGRSILQRGT